MKIFSTAMPFHSYTAPMRQSIPNSGTSAEEVQFSGQIKPQKNWLILASGLLALCLPQPANHMQVSQTQPKNAFVYTLPKSAQLHNSLQDVLQRFPVTTQRTISQEMATSLTLKTAYLTSGSPSPTSQLSTDSDYANQRGVGDCYLESSYNAIIENPKLGPNWIENLIKPVTDPTSRQGVKFIVTFPAYPNLPITVHFDELDFENASDGSKQVQIIEQAYAKLAAQISFQDSLERKGLSKALSGINAGGYPGLAMEILTGVKAIRTSPALAEDVFKRAEQDPDRYTMVIYDYDEKKLKQLPSNLTPAQVVGGHAYTLSYDKKVGKWFIANPWGPGANPRYHAPLRAPITIEQMSNFAAVDIVDLGNANPFPGQKTPRSPNYQVADFVYNISRSPIDSLLYSV